MLMLFFCSLSRSGSSWQSWPSVSASLVWHKSASIMPRTMEVFCSWPLHLGMLLWLPSLQRGQSVTEKTTLPSWPTSCRESKYYKWKDFCQRKYKWKYVDYRCFTFVDYHFIVYYAFLHCFSHWLLFWIWLWCFSWFLLFVFPDWTTVWSSWSRPIVYQKQPFLPAHICPAKCPGLYSHSRCHSSKISPDREQALAPEHAVSQNRMHLTSISSLFLTHYLISVRKDIGIK